MQFYDVAKIVNTHGLKGEVKLAVITDFPEERFKAGSQLTLKDNHDFDLTVKSSRTFKQFWLVQFEEVDSIEAAEKLKGKIIVVSEENQHALPQGTYYYHDIIGLTVLDNQTKQNYGKVTSIESPGANDIWLVKDEQGKEFWLPYIKDVVKKVDLAEKKVYVELIEGLRDED